MNAIHGAVLTSWGYGNLTGSCYSSLSTHWMVWSICSVPQTPVTVIDGAIIVLRVSYTHIHTRPPRLFSHTCNCRKTVAVAIALAYTLSRASSLHRTHQLAKEESYTNKPPCTETLLCKLTMVSHQLQDWQQPTNMLFSWRRSWWDNLSCNCFPMHHL